MSSLDVTAYGPAADAVSEHVPTLVEEQVASKLFARDAELWGSDAREEAGRRLAWVDLARASRPLVGEVAALREELRSAGLSRVVLCGMGGSSLAAEVICATHGVDLTVLDSSSPDAVRSAMSHLKKTVVVVSSTSGTTLETDSQRRAFEKALRDEGLDPARHIVVVTDPGSDLDTEARRLGYRVVGADPGVGGGYCALSAFGLVPSGLAGADISTLLDEAEVVADLLAADDDANPALRLAAVMAGTDPLRDKLVLVDDHSGIVGLPAWVEQLVAESTGKLGKGILPVVAAGVKPATTYADATVVHLVPDLEDDYEVPEPRRHPDSVAAEQPGPADRAARVEHQGSVAKVAGPLGAQLLLWEVATAVAGRLLGLNPFDQPDVEKATSAARAALEGGTMRDRLPDLVDGAVEVRAEGGWFDGEKTLPATIAALLRELDDMHGYVAVTAYLDREQHASFEDVARAVFDRTGRPATFGWGPRYLHSTGQYHKGGPRTGVFVQVTADPDEDLDVPGRGFTFGQLLRARAIGDARVLVDLGRPVLRLHLTSVGRGLSQVRAALATKAGE